jgi:hypothetical protein
MSTLYNENEFAVISSIANSLLTKEISFVVQVLNPYNTEWYRSMEKCHNSKLPQVIQLKMEATYMAT